jgi:NitT/TauT family transport system ATP-binding protein
MSSLAAISVSKEFPGQSAGDPPVRALSNVSFTVNDNEFCSILGHSGCGKTTMLTMIAGFEQPTGGHLHIDGRPVGRPGWQRSMIFQDYALFHWLTVADNIAFGLEMKSAKRQDRNRIVGELIDLVGLKGFESRYPHQLSGGMRQRVSIARALAVEPQVLLMDEPFAALDAQNRALMQRETERILASTRTTVVLVTHSIEEAILLSDRIVVMTRRPGTVKANIEVDLPRPRDEDDPRVIALKRQIRALIHDEFEIER